MPKAEQIKRSHGPMEYILTLSEEEMHNFYWALEDAHGLPHPVLAQIANAMDLLDKENFRSHY